MKRVRIETVITFAVRVMALLFAMAFEPVTAAPLVAQVAETISEVWSYTA